MKRENKIPMFNFGRDVYEASISNNLPTYLELQAKKKKKKLTRLLIALLILLMFASFVFGYVVAIKVANPIDSNHINFNGVVHAYDILP